MPAAQRRTHHEARRRAALLHRLHGVLHLEKTPLWAPCCDVCIILWAPQVEREGARMALVIAGDEAITPQSSTALLQSHT